MGTRDGVHDGFNDDEGRADGATDGTKDGASVIVTLCWMAPVTVLIETPIVILFLSATSTIGRVRCV